MNVIKEIKNIISSMNYCIKLLSLEIRGWLMFKWKVKDATIEPLIKYFFVFILCSIFVIFSYLSEFSDVLIVWTN